MSNPFATFRKNKNYWMAALVLLSILAFVVAPAIMQVQESLRGGGAENAVVVRWDGGRLTVSDLQNNMQKHGALVRFLSQLAREVVDKGGQPAVPGFRYDPQSKQILDLGIQANSSEEAIARTRILAEKARRMGVEFTDQAIDDFILAYCDGRISTNRLAEILREASDGRLSNFDVRELLKRELAAMVVLSTGTTGLYANVPGATYQDFLKLNQTAKVEAFPVSVADFIDQVKGSPSEGEVQAIYELGSNRIADPSSPEPGFVLPYQANLEYVEANLQAWVDREKAKLTEEELRAEYDRRVALEQLKVPVDSPQSPAAGQANPPAPAGSEQPADSDQPADGSEQPPAPEQPAAATPADEDAPPAADAANSDTAPNSDASTSGDATSGDGQPPAVEESSLDLSPASPDSNDQSRRTSRRVHLVAAPQADSGSQPPPVVQPPQLEAVSETTTASQPAAGDEPAPAAEAPATENPAAENPAAENPPTPEAAPAGDTAAATASETAPAAEGTTAGEPAAEGQASGPAMRTLSFEEAREQIATSLAQATAFQSLDVPLTQIQQAMNEYYTAYRQYAAFRDAELQPGEEKLEEPRRPDIKKMAEDAGLVYGQTGMTDGFKLFQTQVGMSDIRDEGMGFSGTVASSVMNPNVPLFQPLQSSYIDREAAALGNLQFFQYLLWKTDEQPVKVPELGEIRQQVVDYWKQMQAQKLAENQATALSKKVNGSSQTPWQDALSTAQQSLVVSTDPFTWFSRMGDYHMPSTVSQLDNVGGEFMQSVFSSSPGQVIVAPNANRSVYYVVRIEQFSPDAEELRQRFEADPDKRGPQSIAQEENSQLVQGWLENLYNELGVQFEIPLNQL